MESEKKEKKYGVIKFSLLLLLYIFYCVVYFTFKNDLGGRGLVKDFFWIVPFVIYFMNAKRIKNNYVIKFIISSFLFCYLYYFMYISVSESHISSAFLAVIFSYIIIIFMHIPLFIYTIYCFSKVCGRIPGSILGICIVICIFYPAYSFKKQFDHLCNTSKNEAFDKIKKEDYVNLYGLNNPELKKYVKEKLGIEFSGYSITGIKLKNNSGYTSYPKIEILKDGRLRIAETSIFKNYKFFKGILAHGENNLICKEAKNFLTDALRSKIEYTQKNYTCSLIVPFIRYRLSCRWGE